MQLRPPNKLVSIPEHNIFRDVRARGDLPRSWAWGKKKARKPSKVVNIPIATFLGTSEVSNA